MQKHRCQLKKSSITKKNHNDMIPHKKTEKVLIRNPKENIYLHEKAVRITLLK